jgi:hypothetical protein
VNLEQEAVELCFGKRIGSFLLDRVSGREDEKRIGKRVRLGPDGDPFLLHRLKEGRLRLRRRPIDFVGQDQVVKDGPGHEAHESPTCPQRGVCLLVQDVGARNIRRQEVRRELNAAE